MTAKVFQHEIKKKLEAHFGETVVVEWTVSKGATDPFAPNRSRYSPRVDVAVNTAGTAPGNHLREIGTFWAQKAPEKLKQVFWKVDYNRNPRCTLAIEVVFSGSPKQILGDITNASMMGLYGIVIPSPNMEARVKRVIEYVVAIRAVGKAPENLFQNVRIIPQGEFVDLIS